MAKQLVKIRWKDPRYDWPWFWLLKTDGARIKLKGADYPNGSAKHEGDVFYVHKSEIAQIESYDGLDERGR
jgi:hypothetical protein